MPRIYLVQQIWALGERDPAIVARVAERGDLDLAPLWVEEVAWPMLFFTA